LIGKPVFREVVREFLAFVGDDVLVIHNAQFDINFLNHELGMLGEKSLSFDRVVDTLALARRRHPAGPNTLDALCKRYGIDNSKRTKHGALVDSLLLAEVYVELLGERQATFGLQTAAVNGLGTERRSGRGAIAKTRPERLPSRLSEADIAAHRTFVDKMGAKAIWRRFWETASS
jgi:DNA polymerase-3 subunit epsilon